MNFEKLIDTKAKRLRGYQKDVPALFDFVLKLYGSGKSHAQFQQDIFAWVANGMKRNGYFVEFGGTDGIELSNSYLLENEFGWTGIVAEPGRLWHDALKRNRNCQIEFDCVWKSTGDRLEFHMLEEAALSTLTKFDSADGRRRKQKKGETYMVDTISLEDMLHKHGAPDVIDFLSIDTEGSEFEILNAFDFSKYRFNVITCEHNFTPVRKNIQALLASKGYKHVFPRLSHCDDWFIHESLGA